MHRTAQRPAQSRPARAVLEGVRRVSFGVTEEGRDVEGCPFPSCLSACLEWMGEGLGSHTLELDGEAWQENNTYIHLMGTTGAAFRLSWRPGWHPDNVDIAHMSDDPAAPLDRAFDSVGFSYEHLAPRSDRDDEKAWRERIIESIGDLTRPVLAFGVVGPPECCLLTGYDDEGEVLIGWSFFQDFAEFSEGIGFEPSGHFRRRDWFRGTQALILIGDKLDRPPLKAIHQRALRWALQVVWTPLTGGDRQNGLAAYRAWADHLSEDDEFPPEDLAALFERYMVHNDAVGTVAEGRWYASLFLRQVLEHEPRLSDELMAAAACYRTEHDLMWEIWKLVGGPQVGEDQARRLAEPAIRREIVPMVHQARDRDAEAASLIEQALAK